MMVRGFARLPIRQKLVAMIMATAGAVLLLACAGYLAIDYFRGREDVVQDLHTQARVVADNSGIALIYDDLKVANENLQTLRNNPHIRLACLYKAPGTLFARYPADGNQACPTARADDGYAFGNNGVQLWTTSLVEGSRAGSLFIDSDLGILVERLRDLSLVVLGLLVVALAVALFLSARLQGFVSEPVMSLARTATKVSTEGDYSLRAQRGSDDELGLLVDSFNRMLERIQLRETELSKANEELRKEIVERRRAEQERAELLVREREANRLKDEFLATLSHELRTPLNAILGWTRLLRNKAVPPDGFDRALEKVERNAQVQTRLVEDLLEVSRIASGKLRLEFKPFDLVTLANTALDSLRPTAEARGISLQRRFSDATLPTAGDPDRLQQVIWNLLSNAVKFTPAGGIVTISLTRSGSTDEIVVSDTGIGIDRAFLPNVFEMFRQADASSTRPHGGLGLGLSIVRNLVELHGGKVKAESDGPGKGATLTVTLPVRSGERPAVQLALDGTVGEVLAGVTVVAVDDDEDTRELLATILTRAGAQVRIASSADEGFAACLELRPDALVTDIGMPGQDGYGLLRQLQAAMGSEAPKVTIALTAFATERDRSRTIDAGFSRHVAKPFEPSALVQMISESRITHP